MIVEALVMTVSNVHVIHIRHSVLHARRALTTDAMLLLYTIAVRLRSKAELACIHNVCL